MRRRHFVVASLLSATVMAGAVHPPAARTSGSARVIDDPDAYDVYAALLRASHDSGAPDISQYVIRRETFTLATGCAVSGEPTDPVWRAALADYVSVNGLPHALVEGYAFDLPYTLVPTTELQEAFAEDAVEWQTFGARFPAAIGYFTFSDVEVGHFYSISASSKLYQFPDGDVSFNLNDNLSGISIIGYNRSSRR